MTIISGRGLFAGIEKRLTADEARFLDDAFENLNLQASRRPVASPGRRILESYLNETALKRGIRRRFQSTFLKLLRPSPSFADICCQYHRSMLAGLRPAMARDDGTWLMSFLEVLTACTIDLHYQMHSPIPCSGNDKVRLSRMMPLTEFIRIHASGCNSDLETQAIFADRLSSRYAPRTRRSAIASGELGEWTGRVGTYPGSTKHPNSDIKPYVLYCESVKPFATLTDKITEEFDRTGSPDRVLQKLGIDFAPGESWIELTYSSDDVRFQMSETRELSLAIPTRIESAGHWAFRPDRDKPAVTNYALDLATALRGLPELIHERLDAGKLDDAIVWGKPTASDWTNPASPLLQSHAA